MPRDPSLMHISALLLRMDDRLENIENRINSLMDKLEHWIGSDDDDSEYTLDWDSEDITSMDEWEEETTEANVPVSITINGVVYELEITNSVNH